MPAAAEEEPPTNHERRLVRIIRKAPNASIGVNIVQGGDGHSVVVESVTPGTAADTAGIKSKDRIGAVDGEPLQANPTIQVAVTVLKALPKDFNAVIYRPVTSSTGGAWKEKKKAADDLRGFEKLVRSPLSVLSGNAPPASKLHEKRKSAQLAGDAVGEKGEGERHAVEVQVDVPTMDNDIRVDNEVATSERRSTNTAEQKMKTRNSGLSCGGDSEVIDGHDEKESRLGAGVAVAVDGSLNTSGRGGHERNDAGDESTVSDAADDTDDTASNTSLDTLESPQLKALLARCERVAQECAEFRNDTSSQAEPVAMQESSPANVDPSSLSLSSSPSTNTAPIAIPNNEAPFLPSSSSSSSSSAAASTAVSVAPSSSSDAFGLFGAPSLQKPGLTQRLDAFVSATTAINQQTQQSMAALWQQQEWQNHAFSAMLHQQQLLQQRLEQSMSMSSSSSLPKHSEPLQQSSASAAATAASANPTAAAVAAAVAASTSGASATPLQDAEAKSCAEEEEEEEEEAAATAGVHAPTAPAPREVSTPRSTAPKHQQEYESACSGAYVPIFSRYALRAAIAASFVFLLTAVLVVGCAIHLPLHDGEPTLAALANSLQHGASNTAGLASLGSGAAGGKEQKQEEQKKRKQRQRKEERKQKKRIWRLPLVHRNEDFHEEEHCESWSSAAFHSSRCRKGEAGVASGSSSAIAPSSEGIWLALPRPLSSYFFPPSLAASHSALVAGSFRAVLAQHAVVRRPLMLADFLAERVAVAMRDALKDHAALRRRPHARLADRRGLVVVE